MISSNMQKKLDIIMSIDSAFSNTPVAKVELNYNGNDYTLYGKCEFNSFTGSVKDRVMRRIVSEGIKSGKVTENTTLIEATSGNTGIAISAIASSCGLKCEVVTPEWTTETRLKLIKQFGSKITLISEKEGGYNGSIEYALKKCRESKQAEYFCPNQFGNEINIAAHVEGEMKEFFDVLEDKKIVVDVCAGGYGTGGMLMGFQKTLESHNQHAKVFAVEPIRGQMLAKGHKPGYVSVDHLEHKIEGIADDLVPVLLENFKHHETVVIDDDDAILVTKMFNRMGLSIGISSGFNIVGCLKALEKEGKSVGAVIFCDNNAKYGETDLFKSVDSKSDFISAKISNASYRFI